MQHDFILLDRSGSMEGRWAEALSAINHYVKKLADEKVDTGVTLAAFDGNGGLDYLILRDRILPATWHPVTNADAVPRGSTPLNDAIGRMVAQAAVGGYDKVAPIIMTDGQENASREVTATRARQLLDECRAKGWQVIFLGADFDNAAQAAGYNNAPAATVQVAAQNLTRGMEVTASLRAGYGATGQAMHYTEEQKRSLR